MNHILLHVSLPNFQEKILKENWLPWGFIDGAYDNLKAIERRTETLVSDGAKKKDLFVIDIEIKGARRA